MLRRVVEHVYLTYWGGTPMVHLSRAPATDGDQDLIASMFTAVQHFMDDSFRSMGIGDVRSFEMGTGHHVAFGRGQYALLYVLYRGRESNRLEDQVEHAVREIEQRFEDLLRRWDGDVERVLAVKRFLEREFGIREPAFASSGPGASPTIAAEPGPDPVLRAQP